LLQKVVWAYRRRFSHSPSRDGVVYGALLLLVILYGLISTFGPLNAPFCDRVVPDLPFRNPDFDADPCLTQRFIQLGGLTLRECEFIRNILMAILLGSVVGFERRAPDRAAGIRSMSLTALGACCFTIAGNFAYESGPMNWDSSRVSAAIPSGVGFLGAGIIWKGFVKSTDGGADTHQVHGLTTASSVWLSAAIGTACGGNLLPQATCTVAAIVLMLRFGPRNSELPDHQEDDSNHDPDSFPFDQPQLSRAQSFATQPLLANPEPSTAAVAESSQSALRRSMSGTRAQSFKLTRAPSKRRTLTTET